jgi:seryl-tRNA synthetase
MESAARASGSRFAYLKGDLVRVELALVQLAFATLEPGGFTPVAPPVLVREQPLFWTGFLPTDRAQIYEVAGDDLYLVGTSEVSLAALHADDLLAEPDLPLRYGGFSTCFRREAGAAGRDTRGIFRVHQFDKVEMFSFVRPEDSTAEHELILSIEERLLQALEIPYRVVNIPAGDLGASAAKKYDLEAWLPGQGRYRELTSCSNTTDYQARRLRCRYRPEGSKSPRPVHTLNGTAVAVGRTIVAIMENCQRADGGVDVPAALREHGAPDEIRPLR